MEFKAKGYVGNLFNDCETGNTHINFIFNHSLNEDEIKKLANLYSLYGPSGIKITLESEDPILTAEEKRYLNNVISPFRNRIDSITKNTNVMSREFISIEMDGGDTATLPYFKENTMYKNMEPNKEYSLEELGL